MTSTQTIHFQTCISSSYRRDKRISAPIIIKTNRRRFDKTDSLLRRVSCLFRSTFVYLNSHRTNTFDTCRCATRYCRIQFSIDSCRSFIAHTFYPPSLFEINPLKPSTDLSPWACPTTHLPPKEVPLMRKLIPPISFKTASQRGNILI
jgi:hypothetical protein